MKSEDFRPIRGALGFMAADENKKAGVFPKLADNGLPLIIPAQSP
jgi:hypothetical protein